MTYNEKLAYLAGIVDGEGSFIVENKREKQSGKRTDYCIRWKCKLFVGMKNEEIIFWIKENFGGNVYYVEKHNIYHWQLLRKDILIPLIRKLLKYLKEKRKQAILLLDYYDNFKNLKYNRNKEEGKKEINRRIEIRRKVKSLNVDNIDVDISENIKNIEKAKEIQNKQLKFFESDLLN